MARSDANWSGSKSAATKTPGGVKSRPPPHARSSTAYKDPYPGMSDPTWGGDASRTAESINASNNIGIVAHGPAGSSGSSQLTFPNNLGTDSTQMNMIMFTPKEITGGGADPRTITFKRAPRAPIIALPIPSGLNTAYTQSWSAASVAGRNAMLTDKGGDVIKRLSESLTTAPAPGGTARQARMQGVRERKRLSDITKDLLSGGSIGGAMNMAKEVGSAIMSTDFWDETAGGVAAELSAMVAAGPAEGLATAAQYTTGMRAVKQTMMSYGGPGFRSFSYTFSLKPFNSAETETVQRIIDTFTQYSAPNQNTTRYTRVYDLPYVFKIQFFYGASEHRYIAKVGHCALTNIGISYGGGKFSTFAGTHAPVQVDLTLNFQEMELLNREMMTRDYAGGTEWPLGGPTTGSHNLPAKNAVNAPAAGSGPS